MKNASGNDFADYAAIAVPIISIIMFFALLKVYPQSEIAIAVISIGFQMSSVLIQIFRNKLVILETKGRLDELTGRPDLRLYGSMGQAEQQFAYKLKSARNIRNTFINVPANRGDGPYSESVKNGYATWFENKIEGTWEDVVGKEEIRDIRFTDWKFDAKGTRKSHFAYTVDCRTSFINFCIIEYSDGKREVMFGWISDMDNRDLADSRIFISDDPNLISTYESTFAKLKNSSHASKAVVPH